MRLEAPETMEPGRYQVSVAVISGSGPSPRRGANETLPRRGANEVFDRSIQLIDYPHVRPAAMLKPATRSQPATYVCRGCAVSATSVALRTACRSR